MNISIIVPVYNEERLVGKMLSELDRTRFPGKTEVIIVNDGSKDGSKKVIERFIKGRKNYILLDKENGGKGSALSLGFSKASGDIIAVQDADTEYPPAELSRLISIMQKEDLPVIYGTRFKNKNRWAIKTHYIGNRFLSLTFSLLFWQYVEDMETCYKVIRARYLRGLKLKSKDFRIEVEVTAKLVRQGLKIKEVPIKYNPRDYSEGKKINWVDGIKALFAILRFRFFD